MSKTLKELEAEMFAASKALYMSGAAYDAAMDAYKAGTQGEHEMSKSIEELKAEMYEKVEAAFAADDVWHEAEDDRAEIYWDEIDDVGHKAAWVAAAIAWAEAKDARKAYKSALKESAS